MRGIITTVCLVCFVAAGVTAKSLPLPSYITPCSRNDPDIEACALKRGREVIPKIMLGDRKYKIPVLDPLEISQLQVDEGVLGLKFSASKVKLYGLRKAILDGIRWDPKKKEGQYHLTIPRVEVDSLYEISGQILVLPITGKGKANLTFTDVKVNYTFDYDIVKKKDGQSHMSVKNSDLVFKTSHLFIHLDNLFNGNKLLGDQTNVFMNENWKDLVKELGPVLGDSVGEVMRRIQSNIFELVDYDSVFPDTPVSTE